MEWSDEYTEEYDRTKATIIDLNRGRFMMLKTMMTTIFFTMILLVSMIE